MLSNRPIGPVLLLIFFACFILIVTDRIGISDAFRSFTNRVYTGATILAAWALLLGVLNVLWVHLRRIQTGQPEWTLSLILVVCLLSVLAAGLVNSEGVRSPVLEWLFDSVIAPGQAAIFALLPLFMIGAAWRHLRLGRNGSGWLLTGAVLVLIAQMPGGSLLLPVEANNIFQSIINGPVVATLRGALLGSSLALAVAGLRMLIGRE